jgi:hypothetical protein
MCCAIVALSMTLLAAWRSVSGAPGGRIGWLRRIAIAAIAIGAAAGSAMAADRFAQISDESSPVVRLADAPLCGRLIH